MMFERPEIWQLLLGLLVIVNIAMQMRASRVSTENRARLIEVESKAKQQDNTALQSEKQLGITAELIEALKDSALAQNRANEIANEERKAWRGIVERNAESKMALTSAVEVNTSTLASIQSDVVKQFLQNAGVIMQAKREGIDELKTVIEESDDALSGKFASLKASVDAALGELRHGVTDYKKITDLLERVALALEKQAIPAAISDHDARNDLQIAALNAANAKRKTGEQQAAVDAPTDEHASKDNGND